MRLLLSGSPFCSRHAVRGPWVSVAGDRERKSVPCACMSPGPAAAPCVDRTLPSGPSHSASSRSRSAAQTAPPPAGPCRWTPMDLCPAMGCNCSKCAGRVGTDRTRAAPVFKLRYGVGILLREAVRVILVARVEGAECGSGRRGSLQGARQLTSPPGVPNFYGSCTSRPDARRASQWLLLRAEGSRRIPPQHL